MESPQTIKCESTLSQLHTSLHYYCFKCKEILCNECLILHLCSSAHDISSIKKMDEALTEGKAIFASFKDLLNKANSDILSSPSDNPVEKFLAKKELEYTKIMDYMQAQTQDILEAINQLFALLQKKDAQMTKDDGYRRSIDAVCGELDAIVSNWDSFDANTRLGHFKKIGTYETKSEELLNKVKEKEAKLQKKRYKESAEKQIGTLIEEIGLGIFSNWHRKQADAIKQKIKSQIGEIEKYFDDFPTEEDEAKEKEIESNKVNGKTPVLTQKDATFTGQAAVYSHLNINPKYFRGDRTTKMLLSNQFMLEPLKTSQQQQGESKEADIEMTPSDPQPPTQTQTQPIQIQQLQQPLAKIESQTQPQKEEKTISRISRNTFSSIREDQDSLYYGECLFTIRRKEASSPVEVFCYINKNVVITELSPANFLKCHSPQFPYKNCKTLNLGKSLLITGGCIDSIVTNRTFLLQFDADDHIVISPFTPMIYNKEGHNVLYIHRTNKVLVCSGQLSISAEQIDLNAVEQGWKDLPSLNNMRANGTLVLLNDSQVYCIGGFNNVTNAYVNGYECLNLDDTSKGWRNISVEENIAISTMGFIQLGKSKVLLIGGFAGGKKYSQDGFMFDAEGVQLEGEGDECHQVKIEKRDQVLNKGIIFYSSPQFYLIGDEVVNFDFKQSLIIYNQLTQKARVIQ